MNLPEGRLFSPSTLPPFSPSPLLWLRPQAAMCNLWAKIFLIPGIVRSIPGVYWVFSNLSASYLGFDPCLRVFLICLRDFDPPLRAFWDFLRDFDPPLRAFWVFLRDFDPRLRTFWVCLRISTRGQAPSFPRGYLGYLAWHFSFFLCQG